MSKSQSIYNGGEWDKIVSVLRRDLAAMTAERDALLNGMGSRGAEIARLRAEIKRLRVLLRDCIEDIETYRSLPEFTGRNEAWIKSIREAIGEGK